MLYSSKKKNLNERSNEVTIPTVVHNKQNKKYENSSKFLVFMHPPRFADFVASCIELIAAIFAVLIAAACGKSLRGYDGDIHDGDVTCFE